MLAAYAGQRDMVKTLIKFHDARLDLQDRGGSTALHWAIDGGNLELIDWMLDNKANIKATDYNGWTPLLRVGEYTCSMVVHHHHVCTKLWPYKSLWSEGELDVFVNYLLPNIFSTGRRVTSRE